MINKLERKFGKYAIPHLMNYLIGGYVIGYLFYFGSMITNLNFVSLMTLEPYAILHGFQFWRVITWVLIPPNQSLIFALIMMVFYYQLGSVLEQTWGAFRFNLYIFGGIIATIIGAFVLYFLLGQPINMGGLFSTYYINMSIFLAFAVCYPDMEVRLYFLIPIKMKWMAIVYGVLLVLEVVQNGWVGRVAIICSLLNFVIFYLTTRNYKRVSPKEIHRKQSYRRAAAPPPTHDRSGNPIARHKCAICGRTELTNPELEFRFCSKCNGNYEYCQEHLFTHTHVK